jgi:hypothetical protein
VIGEAMLARRMPGDIARAVLRVVAQREG